jgi:CheY-like chemotaxis protein
LICVSPQPLRCGERDVPPPPRTDGSLPTDTTATERPIALVVDDEHIIAETIAQILEMNGFEAVPLYSGRAALQRAWTQCPKVVITDVIMPDLNGIETAKRLLEYCPSTKILLISGQAATAEMTNQARADGFNFELLAKPLHPEDLLAVLRQLGF